MSEVIVHNRAEVPMSSEDKEWAEDYLEVDLEEATHWIIERWEGFGQAPVIDVFPGVGLDPVEDVEGLRLGWEATEEDFERIVDMIRGNGLPREEIS